LEHSVIVAIRHPSDTQPLHSASGIKRALVMPIAQLLDDSEFDRETKRVVSLAFEMAREALQLGDQSNLAEKTAQRIVELAKGGELDSDLLCESVAGEFRQHL
jgi:hypothetical protein